MSFEDFQDGRSGGRLGYRNRTCLAIPNLHAATVHPTMFQLHPTYESVGDVENMKTWRTYVRMDDGQQATALADLDQLQVS